MCAHAADHAASNDGDWGEESAHDTICDRRFHVNRRYGCEIFCRDEQESLVTNR